MIARVIGEFLRRLRLDDLLCPDLDRDQSIERVVPSRFGDIVISDDGIDLEVEGTRRCLFRATPGNGEW